TEALDPARALSVDLALAHAGQMARMQGYLITGDAGYLSGYRSLLQREESISAELRLRLAGADPEVGRRMLALETAANRWQVNHRFAQNDEQERLRYLQRIPDDQALYDDVLAAEQALTD